MMSTTLWQVCLLSTFIQLLNLGQARLVLPEERTTGLGCVPVGRTVSYQCIITDPNPPTGITIWSGSCQISLQHSTFFEQGTETCGIGIFSAMALYVNGSNYVSQLTFNASIELNGTTVSCSLSLTTQISSDVLKIGAVPPPPESLMVTFFSESLTVSWSPPSEPVEGGVAGYVLAVTGEGCGCVSMSISGDITNVTCPGWTAAGQNCSFEVRTLSQDCGFYSDSVTSAVTLSVCNPAELGNSPSSTNSSGTAYTSNGEILYNGVAVGSTASLICNDDYIPEVNSSNRTCISDGKWSGSTQNCISTQVPSSQQHLGFIALLILLLLILFVAGLIAGCWKHNTDITQWKKALCILITLGGFYVGKKLAKCAVKISTTTTPSIPAVSSPGPKEALRESTTTTPSIPAVSSPGPEEEPSLENFIAGVCVPTAISRPVDAVAYNNIAYFRSFRQRTIYKYDSTSQVWSILESVRECPVKDTSLTILPVHDDETGKTNYILHTVGGCLREGRVVDNLYCWNEKLTADHDCSWDVSSFPPMITKRSQVTTVCDKEHQHLVVAGGRDKDGPMTKVEILATVSKQWSPVASLPNKMYRANGCLCGEFVYILGGFNYDEASNQIASKIAFAVSLSTLIKSQANEENVFRSIEDLPYVRSVCTTFCNRVFAIGGTKDGNCEPTNEVYLYHPQNNLWEKFPRSLIENRCYCFAISFVQPKPQLMVVGGYTTAHDKGCTNSVEIACLKES